MAFPSTIGNSSTITTEGAVCFRDPTFYHYTNSAESFCEQLVWSKEYLNMVSSIIIGLLGFYQLTWENHNFPVIRFISGLFICCCVSSFLNHYYNTRPYMLLENFTMFLIEYIMLSIVTETYCKNVYILLNKSAMSDTKSKTKSQILTGLNWMFSTFCIYFLLYRDISGCDWGTWVYKLGYALPITIMLLFVAFAHLLQRIYKINVGTVSHGAHIAKKALHYFQRGTSLLFVGVFVWILVQSTCRIEYSGIEYIPAHFIFHILFGYGFILISQYYIFLVNDNNGNRMILSQRTVNSNALLNTVFPYFMKYKGIYHEERQRMVHANSDEHVLSDIVGTSAVAAVSTAHAASKSLKETIQDLNKANGKKTMKLKKKIQSISKDGKPKRKATYDDFNVNDYGVDIVYDQNKSENTTTVPKKKKESAVELQKRLRVNSLSNVEEDDGNVLM